MSGLFRLLRDDGKGPLTVRIAFFSGRYIEKRLLYSLVIHLDWIIWK